MLELGIGGFGDPALGGGSLRMWKRFFPRAVLYGVDLFDKTPLREQRIHTIQGDLPDAAFLTSLGDELGPFDMVIDDGSHNNTDVITAFWTLFPYVRNGGMYIVEDLQTSYWPGYGGSSSRARRPGDQHGVPEAVAGRTALRGDGGRRGTAAAAR
ncbi:class I SAM-dependent methyltransferase [Streptomyces sp. NPDC051041]|uniref:class I SAM-dependent methyltransferase n=1 Tax=Streptomyces sp. NPDC051041 TaxID=3365640 RepID=UPI0037B93B25